MMSAEPRRRNEERARMPHLLIYRTHRDVERFNAHAQGFMPFSRIKFTKIAFMVKCGQPVNSVDWAGSRPSIEKDSQCVCIWRVRDAEHFYAQRLEAFRERFSHTSAVGHHHNTSAVFELHACRLAEGE